MKCPPHSNSLEHSNYTCGKVQIIKPLITKFSPVPPLTSQTKLRTNTELQAKLVLNVLIFTFLGSRREDDSFRIRNKTKEAKFDLT
jgi:hypothetical protein